MSVSPLQQIDLLDLNDVEPTEELRERFRVTDLSSANWCLRKLQALTAQTRDINGVADTEIERINAWREKELGRLQKHVEFFEYLLTDYHREALQSDPKAKTITTPYGKLKSVTRKESPNKVDDDKLLAHLKQSGETDYVVVKESPAWAEYKKTLHIVERGGQFAVVDENGAVVPGVEVDLGGTKFSVEVSE